MLKNVFENVGRKVTNRWLVSGYISKGLIASWIWDVSISQE
jgi:hypothetical protein